MNKIRIGLNVNAGRKEEYLVQDSPELLKLRILLSFRDDENENCTVTGLSRALREEKQKISRAMIAMEKDGLLNRSNNRAPFLTDKGRAEARKYAERIRISQDHLLYEGVDIESAMHDAYVWALHCSDALMDVVRVSSTCYRVKHELRNLKSFGGDTLCKRLEDGCYEFPFIIYREEVKNGNNISMSNEGFAHPCTLYIDQGEGLVQLLIQTMSKKSGLTGSLLKGKVDKLEYFYGGRFISAEINNNVVSFPAEAIKFINMGTGIGNILHGSVQLRMRASCGIVHMPESTAIFTILI